MSVSTEISRITADRNTIRAKLVELGMATGTDNLTKLAAAIEAIVNQGAVSVEIDRSGNVKPGIGRERCFVHAENLLSAHRKLQLHFNPPPFSAAERQPHP